MQTDQRLVKVLLVTSWATPCGIAEHSKLLKESVELADPLIQILPSSEALDPEWVKTMWTQMDCDLIHLNHHDGLHSRWTPEYVAAITATGVPVLVTYHDTRERLADCPKLEMLAGVASSVVVHEPVEGLKAIYWRQGVPAPAEYPVNYLPAMSGYTHRVGEAQIPFKAYWQQPVLGTVGFNFPWKNYDRLAKETADAGWALVILSNNATQEDELRWKALNSSIRVVREFLTQEQVVNYLAGCDATAFMYECANTGTSAAIRQGIAARKMVIALKTCRQFRDLTDEEYVSWVQSWDEFRSRLDCLLPHPFDPLVHKLAVQESWAKKGLDYANLYLMLAGVTRV